MRLKTPIPLMSGKITIEGVAVDGKTKVKLEIFRFQTSSADAMEFVEEMESPDYGPLTPALMPPQPSDYYLNMDEIRLLPNEEDKIYQYTIETEEDGA